MSTKKRTDPPCTIQLRFSPEDYALFSKGYIDYCAIRRGLGQTAQPLLTKSQWCVVLVMQALRDMKEPLDQFTYNSNLRIQGKESVDEA